MEKQGVPDAVRYHPWALPRGQNAKLAKTHAKHPIPQYHMDPLPTSALNIAEGDVVDPFEVRGGLHPRH